MTNDATVGREPETPRGWTRLAPDCPIAVGDRWYDFDDNKWWEFQLVALPSRNASEYGLVIRRNTDAG